MFIEYASNMYKPFIDEYNQLMIDHHIAERVEEYLKTLKRTISAKDFAQFEKDVRTELSLIK